MPSHYLNQCWWIVNWNLGNKFQRNLNWNSNSFIQENVSSEDQDSHQVTPTTFPFQWSVVISILFCWAKLVQLVQIYKENIKTQSASLATVLLIIVPGIYSALSIYRGHFYSYNSRKTAHSSPVRVRYGVSLASANLTEVVLLIPVLCALSYHIQPRYIESIYIYIYMYMAFASQLLYV